MRARPPGRCPPSCSAACFARKMCEGGEASLQPSSSSLFPLSVARTNCHEPETTLVRVLPLNTTHQWYSGGAARAGRAAGVKERGGVRADGCVRRNRPRPPGVQRAHRARTMPSRCVRLAAGAGGPRGGGGAVSLCAARLRAESPRPRWRYRRHLVSGGGAAAAASARARIQPALRTQAQSATRSASCGRCRPPLPPRTAQGQDSVPGQACTLCALASVCVGCVSGCMRVPLPGAAARAQATGVGSATKVGSGACRGDLSSDCSTRLRTHAMLRPIYGAA